MIAAAIVFACPATAMAATPAGLTVEHQTQPLAVEAAAPLLGWHGAGDAYQVKVGTSPSTLGDVWDSGKVQSTDSVNVPYGGPALPNATRLYWTVRTFEGDRASAYAPPASFGTAVKSAWTATPIWSSAPVLGTDYDVDVDFTVTTVAAGIKFRVNGSNSFMWQIRGDSSNELRPHVQVNGTYSQLKAVRLPMTIGLNTKHHARINVVGSTIRTYIDDVLVDTTVDTRNPNGSIGFRHGNTESARFDNVKVTSDRVLYQNDFSAPSTDFACGTVTSGELVVGTARDCSYGVTDNWAFLRKGFRVADKPIAWATAYVSARSTEPARQYVFKLSLNGKVVGVGPTRAINNATQTMYNAYDVTALLKAGDNALGALAYTTADKKFIAQLVIAYADGTREVVSSDTSWKALAGEVALPQAGSIGTSYYVAPVENIDARQYPSGFDTAGVRRLRAGPPPRPRPPSRASPARPPRTSSSACASPSPSSRPATSGTSSTSAARSSAACSSSSAARAARRSRSGWARSSASPNVVDYTMRTGNTYRDVWTLRPGTQTLNLWGYRVFRYAEVIGADPEEIKATALVYPYDPAASSWSSSNAALDRVVDFNREGVRELNLDLHLDSPSRERAPYEGDNLIHMLIQGYTDGDWTLSKYTLQWLAVNETWPTEWRFS